MEIGLPGQGIIEYMVRPRPFELECSIHPYKKQSYRTIINGPLRTYIIVSQVVQIDHNKWSLQKIYIVTFFSYI